MRTPGALLLLTVLAGQAFAGPGPDGMILVPAGTGEPFFQPNPGKGKAPVATPPLEIAAFRLDAAPVANRQFLAFVRQHPEWRKTRVKRLFADDRYLARWAGDLELEDAEAGGRPVTNVSWFAAQAYCVAHGKSLPATEQWEYALADAGRDKAAVDRRLLDWFAAPNPPRLPDAGSADANGFGVQGMVGLVWEWTLDFNSFMTGTELRNTDGKDNAEFCGNGSTGVKDATDYAAFMRYAMRTSLKASYTVDNVGFRCSGAP